MAKKKLFEEGEKMPRTEFHRPTRAIPHKKEKLSEQDYYKDLEELGYEDGQEEEGIHGGREEPDTGALP